MFELTVIVALITGLGQIIKKHVPNQFMPYVSLVLGLLAGIFYVDGVIEYRIFIGLALGVAANGTFDLTKVASKGKKPKPEKRNI